MDFYSNGAGLVRVVTGKTAPVTPIVITRQRGECVALKLKCAVFLTTDFFVHCHITRYTISTSLRHTSDNVPLVCLGVASVPVFKITVKNQSLS